MRTRTTAAVATALACCSFAAVAWAETIVGTDDNDRLRGTPEADTIDANDGNDRVAALAGDDVVLLDDGNDRARRRRGQRRGRWPARGATASAAVTATTASSGNRDEDRLFGNLGADFIHGGAGGDIVIGNAGDDELIGDTPNVGRPANPDRVFGGPGADSVTGGDGRDRLHGGADGDTITGNGGRDLISGGTGNDTSNGNRGADTVFANLGQDTSFGGDGPDRLFALAHGDVDTSAGPDTAGDTLDGGAGNDRFATFDGETDTVTCGPGRDVAVLDAVDDLADDTPENPLGSCERVVRREPRPGDDEQENQTQYPPRDDDQG